MKYFVVILCLAIFNFNCFEGAFLITKFPSKKISPVIFGKWIYCVFRPSIDNEDYNKEYLNCAKIEFYRFLEHCWMTLANLPPTSLACWCLNRRWHKLPTPRALYTCPTCPYPRLPLCRRSSDGTRNIFRSCSAETHQGSLALSTNWCRGLKIKYFEV